MRVFVNYSIDDRDDFKAAKEELLKAFLALGAQPLSLKQGLYAAPGYYSSMIYEDKYWDRFYFKYSGDSKKLQTLVDQFRKYDITDSERYKMMNSKVPRRVKFMSVFVETWRGDIFRTH
jgi:hypothetical protein